MLHQYIINLPFPRIMNIRNGFYRMNINTPSMNITNRRCDKVQHRQRPRPTLMEPGFMPKMSSVSLRAKEALSQHLPLNTPGANTLTLLQTEEKALTGIR